MRWGERAVQLAQSVNATLRRSFGSKGGSDVSEATSAVGGDETGMLS